MLASRWDPSDDLYRYRGVARRRRTLSDDAAPDQLQAQRAAFARPHGKRPMSKSKSPRPSRPTAGSTRPSGAARSAGGSSPAGRSTATKQRSAVPQSAEQRRKAAQRSVIDARRGGRRNLYTILPVAIAVVLIAALVVVYIARGGNDAAGQGRSAASDTVAAAVKGVPAAALDSVGSGTVKTSPTLVANYQPLFAADGTLRVLYVGAEYCPFCAGERWSLAIAMARFGDFANLQQTASSPTDTYPNTATLSFYGASYTSTYLTFSSYETADSSGKALQDLSSGDKDLTTKFNNAPYVSSAGSIPFLLIGGKYVFSGASFDVSVLQGLSHEKIAADLSDPSSPVAKAILGGANELTAAICNVLSDQKNAPADVCSAPGVQAAGAALATLTPVG